MRLTLNTADWATKVVPVRCRHDDSLIGDRLKATQQRFGLLLLDMLQHLARNDDVEVSECKGGCVAKDQLVIQGEPIAELQVRFVHIHTDDMRGIPAGLRPQQIPNPPSPASNIEDALSMQGPAS